jgi:hypothetical protein
LYTSYTEGSETATRGGWMGASNFFRNIWPLSQNQTPRTSTRKNDVFTSQLVAGYLQWWLRDTAEQSRTNGNKCKRDRETTAKTAQSDCQHRELGLSAGQVADCPWWRAGLSGIHTTENRLTRNSSGHGSKNSSRLSEVCSRTLRSSKVTNRTAKKWFCTLLKKWMSDSPMLRGELSAVHNSEHQSWKTGSGHGCNKHGGLSEVEARTVWESQIRIEIDHPKIAPTQNRSVCGQIETNCHQIWTSWLQGNRWATPKRSSLEV